MKKYLVIGNPIEHSLSPQLHNYWIKKNNINAVYDKKQLNKSDIEEIITEVKNGKIDGINVTVPFKKSVIPFLDKLTPLANETRSVNTIYKEKATPKLISKNLAELKANKISKKKNDHIVLGADSVIDLNGELISKPTNRDEALTILEKLNGRKHQLISSVCISKNGFMIWNCTDDSTLTMKQLNSAEIKSYLTKIRDKELYAYGVYQIEADGRSLFSKIEGDENTIMGLPINQIKEYLKNL